MTTRLALPLALSLALAAGPLRAEQNPLQPFRQLTLPGGVASAATCVNFAAPADGGPTGGLLELDTLPPGAAVQGAWLYWTVLAHSTPVPPGSPELDGMPLVPTALGELPASPCYGTYTASGSFRADVTGLVSANGRYQLSGLLGDGTGSAPELTEGASLFVVYCAPGEPDRSVTILDGFDVVNDSLPPFRQDITGFLASATEPIAARLFFAAGNGQSREQPEEPSLDPFLFNGVDLDAEQTEILSGGLCLPNGLYDHHRIDVTGLIRAEDTSAVLEIMTAGDCYTIAALALVVDTTPGLALPEPSALDVDPLATPLLVSRTPMGLALTWEDLGAGRIYHAYRGTLGDWYDHADIGACDLVTPDAVVVEEDGDHYFLAVTEGCGGAESTTGRDSFGAGRPSAAAASGLPCP